MAQIGCFVYFILFTFQVLAAQENEVPPSNPISVSHTNDLLDFMLLASFFRNSSFNSPCPPSDPLCLTTLFGGNLQLAEGSGVERNHLDDVIYPDLEPQLVVGLNETESNIPPDLIFPPLEVITSENISVLEEDVFGSQDNHQINGEFAPEISDQTLFDLSSSDNTDLAVDDNVEANDVEGKEFIIQPMEISPELLKYLNDLTSTKSSTTKPTTSHSDVALTTESPQNTRKSDVQNTSFTTSYEIIDQTNTTIPVTQSINETSTATFSIEEFDHTTCGVFPGCTVSPVTSQGFGFRVTCDPGQVMAIVAMTSLLAVIITISNILIVVVTLRTKVLRKPHGYFKLSLAFSDLIAGGVVVPSMINNILTTIQYDTIDVQLLTGVDKGNSPYSIVFGSLGVMSVIVTLHSLLLLSIDRFLSVRWPMKYRIGDIMTPKRAVILISIVWILALAVAVLPVLGVDYMSYAISFISFRCLPNIKPLTMDPESSVFSRYVHAIVYIVLIWGLPFVATWFFTIMTSIQSRRMLNHMREARRSRRSSQVLDRVDLGLRRTVTVVLILFTVTVIPIFSVLINSVVKPPQKCVSKSSALAYFAAIYIFICGSFLNVVVYNVCNGEFRAACKIFCGDIARFICRCRQWDDVTVNGRRRKNLSHWRSSAARSEWQARYGTNRSTMPTLSETLSSKSRTFSANTNRTVSSSSHGSSKISADRACSNTSSVFSSGERT